MLQTVQRLFLHVGCGSRHKDQTTAGFNTPEWKELRFDIDPNNHPDILGEMTDMVTVPNGSVDAVYSSHNIEHLYPHEVQKPWLSLDVYLNQMALLSSHALICNQFVS
ncbi:MAG: Methyltransferase type 11 [Candidatus Magnetoglobus multicellularis str. Araruama]|uniref:Methyltransferase type 11 n=1 Tax=Candidatus Magnetoglobus multicellularis str. Araruama TaxID=890399 RepID=A0A1V1P2U7_9BACT|nr:MAG: Methyltransferase type 11 [Candidatus Magnetoglobus multicellularis str. Araruama]